MERERGYFSTIKKNRAAQLPPSRLLMQGQIKPLVPQFSLGKSSIIKTIQKIQIIKSTCFQHCNKKIQTSSQRPRQKNITVSGDQDLDTSCVISDEQDNADLQTMKNTGNGPLLLTSLYKSRPTTVFFRYPTCCEKTQHQQKLLENKRLLRISNNQSMKYRIYGSQYKCIVNAFQVNGFEKVNNQNWQVFFDVRGSKVKVAHGKIRKGQKFNHFAGCWHLGRKDQLWRHEYKQIKLFPQDYNFIPKTFIFPYDYQRFESARQLYSKNQLWIQKPVASSKGRNIKVVSNQAKISNKKNTLISQYIQNPHLINNLKYDLRIYVLVTSFNPLKIYIYENGLARFATGEYKKKGRKDKFIHLTNFSVNKYSKNFIKNNNSNNPEQQGQSSKWSLDRLRHYYQQNNIDSSYIFKQVQDIVIKTCIAAQSSVLAPKYRDENKRSCSFQLFGFDILIDQKFKAWLMQVNVCPSLCSSSPFDKKIKHCLIVDLMNLVGVNPPKNEEIEKNNEQNSPTIKEQTRKYKFKNPNSISNLNYENCIDLLAPEDWIILLQNQQEMDRMKLGNFQRAFPRKDNILSYQKFFQCSRYNNIVLWKHLLSSKNFLSRINV